MSQACAASSDDRTVKKRYEGVGPSEGIDYVVYEDGSVERDTQD